MAKVTGILTISVLVAVGRFFVPGHDLSWAGSYEAMAHIWVGSLLVWCFADNSSAGNGPQVKERATAIIALVLITALEIVKFLMR